MDPATIVFITSLIISTALSVDQSVGAALANDRSSKLSESATQLAKDISTDQSLVNDLIDAYNRRDVQLANQLMISSPFGSRFYNLRKAYSDNLSNISRANKKKSEIEQNASKAQSKLNERQVKAQTTGSAIADLISGAARADTSTPSYTSSGLSGDQIKEVNYGQKK